MQVVPCELIHITCRFPPGSYLVVLSSGRAFPCPDRDAAEALAARLKTGGAEPQPAAFLQELTVHYVPDAYGIPRRVGGEPPRTTRPARGYERKIADIARQLMEAGRA